MTSKESFVNWTTLLPAMCLCKCHCRMISCPWELARSFITNHVSFWLLHNCTSRRKTAIFYGKSHSQRSQIWSLMHDGDCCLIPLQRYLPCDCWYFWQPLVVHSVEIKYQMIKWNGKSDVNSGRITHQATIHELLYSHNISWLHADKIYNVFQLRTWSMKCSNGK